MARKHNRKQRSSPVMWSFILTLLLIAAIAAVLGIFQTAEEPASLPEPEPVGTPAQAPVADQRPVPAASSVPVAASVPTAAGPAGDAAQSDAASVPGPGADPVPDPGAASAAPAAPAEGAGAPETAQGIDAKDGEQVVRGVIVDASTSSVTIQTADGTRLSFMRETADVTGRIVEEAEVEIYYVGSITGTDTSAAFVTKIISFA